MKRDLTGNRVIIILYINKKLMTILTPAIIQDIQKNRPHLINHKTKTIEASCSKCGKDSNFYTQSDGFMCFSCLGLTSKQIKKLERKYKNSTTNFDKL
jgi:hypothetical protein